MFNGCILPIRLVVQSRLFSKFNVSHPQTKLVSLSEFNVSLTSTTMFLHKVRLESGKSRSQTLNTKIASFEVDDHVMCYEHAVKVWREYFQQ